MLTSVWCLDQKFVRMGSVPIFFLHTPAIVTVASITTTSGLSVWVRTFFLFFFFSHELHFLATFCTTSIQRQISQMCYVLIGTTLCMVISLCSLSLSVSRLWWVWIWNCLWERSVYEHSGVFWLFLQSSISPGQHTSTLRQPQHNRRCDIKSSHLEIHKDQKNKSLDQNSLRWFFWLICLLLQVAHMKFS